MSRGSKIDLQRLMIACAVLAALAGFSGVASWLIEHAIIGPEVKAMLFLGWLIGLVSWLPEPFNAIAIIAIVAIIGIIGVGAFKVVGSVWYGITH